jgi:hypothetical protein
MPARSRRPADPQGRGDFLRHRQGHAGARPRYIEDSSADADANFVLIEGGHIAEVQATAEGATYDEEALLRLLRLARWAATTSSRRKRLSRGDTQAHPGKLVIATHNKGKLKEMQALWRPMAWSACRRANWAARAGGNRHHLCRKRADQGACCGQGGQSSRAVR